MSLVVVVVARPRPLPLVLDAIDRDGKVSFHDTLEACGKYLMGEIERRCRLPHFLKTMAEN